MESDPHIRVGLSLRVCGEVLGGTRFETRDECSARSLILNNYHIGHIIKAEMQRQNRTPSWLAEQIHCERPNIYYIYNQPSINTALLDKISDALQVDFFLMISKIRHGE